MAAGHFSNVLPLYYFTYIHKKMAQLHIQKKRNQLWWLWIIIVLIIIAVVYYLLVINNIIPDTFGIKSYTTTSYIDGYDGIHNI
jgi:hypothetical protein